MARSNLGSKRVCPSCGAKFYDLGKDPAICPECEAAHSQASFLKPRRSRAPIPRAAPKKPASKDEDDGDIALDGEDEEDADVEDIEENDDLGDVVSASGKKDGEDDS